MGWFAKKATCFLLRNSNLSTVNPQGYFSKTLVFLLIAVFTLATSGVVVSKHTCRGHVKNVSLYSLAESCDMEKGNVPCKPNHHAEGISKKACCLDDVYSSKLTTDFSFSANRLFIQDCHFSPIVFLWSGIKEIAFKDFSFNIGLDPPDSFNCITILYQVFRI